MQPQATTELTRDGDRGEAAWFNDHYHDAPRQIVDFLSGDGIALEGRRIADVGCGDGLIDLGLFHAARPAEVVGFDIEPTDAAALDGWARRFNVPGVPSEGLRFMQSTRRQLPVPDARFDVVISWSAFEHIDEPVIMSREIRRVLTPQGVAFIQIWPLYYSEHGSHRWPWFPDGYAQFGHDAEELDRAAEADVPDRITAGSLRGAHLNGITVDELQRCLLAGGLNVTKVELITQAVHVPPRLARYPLTSLAISGVKLIACPDPSLG